MTDTDPTNAHTSPPGTSKRGRPRKPTVARKPRVTKPRRYAVLLAVVAGGWCDVPTGFDAPTAEDCRTWVANKGVAGETYRIIAILAEGKVVEEVKTKRKFA